MAEKDRGNGLPQPVSPEIYTREYFTTDCEGYQLLGEGADALPERIAEALDLAGDLRGKWVLDVGCGRGELACEAAARGARAVGVDYSAAAVELSRERRADLGGELRGRVEFLLADAKGLPFRDGSFDAVFLVDVYEHLHPHEIAFTLGEVLRVLRPGGVLIVHTGPNTWFYRFGYPLVRGAARLLLRRELPLDLRGQYDDVMHVNEQSPLSLHRGLAAAGFLPRVIPRSFFPGISPNRWERAVLGLLSMRPNGYFFCTSLMAVARPREGGGEARLRVNRMLRLISPPRGSRVLLVGEQEGLLARLLSRLEGVEVTWLQPAPGGDGRAAGRGGGGGPCRRIAGDPCRPPFPAGSFDAVAAQFTLDGVEDPAAALRAWAGVLRDGGTLVLAARNRLYRGLEARPAPRPLRLYGPAQLGKAVEAAGFRVTSVSTLVPDLRFPAFYRGDLDLSLRLERIPYISRRGKLLFVRAVKGGEGEEAR